MPASLLHYFVCFHCIFLLFSCMLTEYKNGCEVITVTSVALDISLYIYNANV